MKITRNRAIRQGLLFVTGVVGFLKATPVSAVTTDEITNTVSDLLTNGGGANQTINNFILITLLSLVPVVLIMTTSFTRTIMVLSFVRNSLGTQQNPPNQVLLGLALFLTFF